MQDIQSCYVIQTGRVKDGIDSYNNVRVEGLVQTQNSDWHKIAHYCDIR